METFPWQGLRVAISDSLFCQEELDELIQRLFHDKRDAWSLSWQEELTAAPEAEILGKTLSGKWDRDAFLSLIPG